MQLNYSLALMFRMALPQSSCSVLIRFCIFIITHLACIGKGIKKLRVELCVNDLLETIWMQGVCVFPIRLKTLTGKLIHNQEGQYKKGNYPTYVLLL